MNDNRVFKRSIICERLESGWRAIPNGVLLGDSIYFVAEYLIPPLDNPRTVQEKRFNNAHKKTRRLVECCIGLLKQRFRCLLGKLDFQPERAASVISCCATLHNLVLNPNDVKEALEDYCVNENADNEIEKRNDCCKNINSNNRQLQLIALF